MKTIEEQRSETKRRIRIHKILVIGLSVGILLDFVITFLFQTRETAHLFIPVASLFLFLFLTSISYLLFAYLQPERKYQAILEKYEKGRYEVVEGEITEILSPTRECGLEASRYEVQLNSRKEIGKVLVTLDPELQVGQRVKLTLCAGFIVQIEVKS